MDIPNLCQSSTEKGEREDILQPMNALPDRNKLGSKEVSQLTQFNY